MISIMFKCRCCLFSLLSFLCLCFFAGSSLAIKGAKTDLQALLKLKDGFVHARDILSSWEGDDCCKWKGISCDDLTGHVTTLNLQSPLINQTLGGKIDSSVCELQHLTSFDLSYNYFEGRIPKCIGSLSQLREVNLRGNILVGDIPYTLGNLSNLQTLDLGYNDHLIVAKDLEWLSHLSNLRYLDLSNTNLSLAIDWLSSIRKLSSLSKLYLDDCQLSQANPKSIPHMNSSTSLKILSLVGNELNSSTVSRVLNVSKVLTYLGLSLNSLQYFPDGIANMISLRYLGLSQNELEGTIPNYFQSLCQLEELLLDSNHLSGQLSDSIRQLCCAQNSLKWLVLNNNPLSSGPFPDLSCLSPLSGLYLRNTNIVGSLPQSLGLFPYLTHLDLSYNQLSGSLSSFEVSKLPSLEELILSHNQLNGTVPSTIGIHSSLNHLDISSNKLSGMVSELHVSKLSRLEILIVAGNSLSFNFSSHWIPPFQLIHLDTSSVVLGPKFPTWLKHQRRLEFLDISVGGISDSFPEWFSNISSNLLLLNVSYNELSGTLPKSFPSNKTYDTRIWDFNSNNLFGPLPYLPELVALFLSNNMFSGSIYSICAMSPQPLAYLDLSNNLLEGPLLDCWGNFQNLEVLNLANNNMFGRIPKSFGSLRQIESIHLNNNNLSGEIPSLTHCRNLKFIDFGDNNLEGTLPTWIGHNLHYLIDLRLHANKFLGNIPPSLCNLSFLQVLDLSKNNITGEIPQCLHHIIALSNMAFSRQPFSYGGFVYVDSLTMDKAVLAWKGGSREYGKNLGFMTTIDLSCNHLTGEIPQSITKLVALAGLNLSGNNLTGFIPNNIGEMKMLESLDLSRNYLCGRMPSSFSNLTFLSYMNLSFNNLSGKIPSSTQLQSFGASTYFGNSELCGPPLTNQCPAIAISQTRNSNKNGTNEDEDELITFGFYISMGLGFCFGFWAVCGTLVMKSSWRRAYFQFFNNINDWIYVTVFVFVARTKERDS